MPYTAEHKARTRARIVAVASRLFRRDGYHQTGVDALMGAAGLTRGGFYAHFKDKSALLIEAIEHAFDQSADNLFGRGLNDLYGAEWLRAAAQRYLTLGHRRQPEAGCAVPTLGSEVARGARPVRKVFDARQRDMIERVAERIGGDREMATALVASWVGALVMARIAPRRAQAQTVLEAVRAYWEGVADRL